MHYYGTRLSENISRREPEGYLLCLNVPVARTGTQDYLPEELGLPPRTASGGNLVGGNLTRNKQAPQCGAAPIESAELSPGPPGLVSVLRPEAEVFSPETIASFEGMPVTNDHPPDGVDIGNIRALQKGHAHNVRRGSGEESDLLLADLIITDPDLIDLIMDGKREISCGYTYELCDENGQYIQRKIRGNHVAVVDAGRAGPRVSIKDHKATISERRTRSMKKSLSKILARMAKDGDIETVAEIIEEMIEPGEDPATASGGNLAESEVIRNEQAPQCGAATVENAESAMVAEDPAAVVETPEGTTIVVDEATLGEVLSRLDQIISLLTPAAADEDPAEEVAEAVEEAVEAAVAAAEEPVLPEDLSEGIQPEDVAEIVEEILDPVGGEAVSEVLDPLEDECGEEEQEVLSTGDALRTALKAVRPALARMPKKQRARVCADIAARLKKPSGRRGADAGVYAALAAARRKPPRRNAADLGKRIMANRNINCRK